MKEGFVDVALGRKGQLGPCPFTLTVWFSLSFSHPVSIYMLCRYQFTVQTIIRLFVKHLMMARALPWGEHRVSLSSSVQGFTVCMSSKPLLIAAPICPSHINFKGVSILSNCLPQLDTKVISQIALNDAAAQNKSLIKIWCKTLTNVVSSYQYCWVGKLLHLCFKHILSF